MSMQNIINPKQVCLAQFNMPCTLIKNLYIHSFHSPLSILSTDTLTGAGLIGLIGRSGKSNITGADICSWLFTDTVGRAGLAMYVIGVEGFVLSRTASCGSNNVSDCNCHSANSIVI